MNTRAYKVVDVFTSEPLKGNPVELPFAGHPTLGSAFAVLEAGLVKPDCGELVQECGVGLVRLKVQTQGSGRQVSFNLPLARLAPLSPADVAELESILGQEVMKEAQPVIVNVGAVWVVAELPSVEMLLALEPDYLRSARFERRLGATGLSVFAKYEDGANAIEVRSFAPSCGVNEDPVCGSGNGGIAVFLRERGRLETIGNSYVAGQGQCVGRDGRLMVRVDDVGITLGGNCVTCVTGMLNI